MLYLYIYIKEYTYVYNLCAQTMAVDENSGLFRSLRDFFFLRAYLKDSHHPRPEVFSPVNILCLCHGL